MKRMRTHITAIAISTLMVAFASDRARETSESREIIPVDAEQVMSLTDILYINSVNALPEFTADEVREEISFPAIEYKPRLKPSIYDLPYSINGRCYDWKRLWINTGVLAGAYVSTLFVLECLPENATSWNRAEIQEVPMFTRWSQNIFKKGPEWDHDKIVFNYVLHPYAGAVYYMTARSCGFNVWQSLLYSTIVSTVGWEFGIEAFMERPSIQDIFITPIIGSLIGEGFYHVKRAIVNNGYELAGSPVLGNIVAFLVDPVNEVVGLFGGNTARQSARRGGSQLSSSPMITGSNGQLSFGLSLSYTF